MSHTSKRPPVKYAAADLPTDLPEGTVAYDTTNQKMVAFKQGAWGDLGGAGGVGSTTYVRDDVAGVIDQIQGDIPDNWKKLDTSLKGLVIGTSCTSIGLQAFESCTGLTGSLVIPDSVTFIGIAAFLQCTGLTGGLVIPDSVTTIGTSAFSGCLGFDGTLTIGNGVTTIESFAFFNCTGFAGGLVIPDSVTTIKGGAFLSCTGFAGTLTIPNSVTFFGNFVFQGCTGLTNVDCYVEKSVFDTTNNIDGTSVTTIHVRSTDTTWTAGAGQTVGGKTGITVIKDL